MFNSLFKSLSEYIVKLSWINVKVSLDVMQLLPFTVAWSVCRQSSYFWTRIYLHPIMCFARGMLMQLHLFCINNIFKLYAQNFLMPFVRVAVFRKRTHYGQLTFHLWFWKKCWRLGLHVLFCWKWLSSSSAIFRDQVYTNVFHFPVYVVQVYIPYMYMVYICIPYIV